MDKIPNGRHQARVIDYGLTETKAGDPQVRVKFKLVGDGSEITWFGSLKEGKASEITIDSLLVCGLHGTDLLILEGGSGSGALNEEKIVSIVVEDEEYNGKTTTKVKWINSLDGGAKKLSDNKKGSLKRYSQLVKARRVELGIKDAGPKIDDELTF